MLPLRDSQRAERRPVVNWLLIALNLLVFLYVAKFVRSEDAEREFAERFGLVPARLLAGIRHPSLLFDAPWPWLREIVLPLFTAMFLHGGLAHLLGNLWFLFVFGDNVEGRLGHARYLAFYFVCGLAAWAVHVTTIPAHGIVGETWWGQRIFGANPALDVPAIGASGAIAGVLGAYAVLFKQSRVTTFLPPFFLFEVPARLFLGIWFVIQFFSARGESRFGGLGTGVAYWAHVGGFVTGMAIALIAPKPRSSDPFSTRVARPSWRIP